MDDSGNVWLNFGEYGGEVELACFSPCGTRVLTVKEVGLARVWDVESGEQVGEIKPNSPMEGRSGAGPTSSPFKVFIESAALDHSGKHALLGLNDGTAGIFRVSDGTRLTSLHDPGSEPGSAFGLIRAVAFSPDASLAAIGLRPWTVAIWDLRGGTMRAFQSPRANQPYDINDGPRPGIVSSIGISADNRYIFAGYADMTGTIWDLHTSQIHSDLGAHTDKIRALLVENESARWITSGGNVWGATHNHTPRRILATGKRVAEAAFSHDGSVFLLRGPDGTITLSTIQGAEKTLVTARDDRMSWPEGESTLGFDRTGTCCFYPSAHNCLSWNGDGDTKKLPRQCPKTENLSGNPARDLLSMTRERIDGLVLSPDGRFGATHGWSGDLEIWDLRSGDLRAFVREPEHANVAAFSPNGTLLAIGVLGNGGPGKQREIKLLSPSDGSVKGVLRGHAHQVHQLEFGPDGTWLVSTGLDRAVRLWRVGDGKLIRELRYEDLDFQHLCVLADGRILVFRSRCVEVWRELRTKVTSIPLSVSYGERWAISNDEKVVGTSMGGKIALWSVDDGHPIDCFESAIESPVRIPDTALSIQLTAAAGALLWEGPNAKFIHVGDGPRGWATPLTISSDSRQTLLPTTEGLALIDLTGEQRVLSVLPFEGRLRASRITKEHALAVNSAGKVFRWKLETSESS